MLLLKPSTKEKVKGILFKFSIIHIRNLSIYKKIILGFLIPLTLILFVSSFVYISIERLQETSRWVTHTHQVISDIQELKKLLLDMETGERGYLITGKESFLEPFHNSIRVWDIKLKNLKLLVSDNPSQVSLLNEVDELQKQWLKYAANVEIDTRRKVKQQHNNKTTMTDVIKLIENETGKNLIDRIREIGEKLILEERSLMSIRQDEAKTAVERTERTLILGTSIAILIAVFIAFIISSTIQKNLKSLLKGTDKIKQGNFDDDILVDSNDEFLLLANAFNSMTLSLKSSTEKMQLASQAKGEFLANMSHEIRTPLNGVLGMLTFLEDTKINDEQSSYINSIRSCCDGLLVVINDILDLSKLDAGMLSMEYIPFHLKNLIEETCHLLDSSISQKSLSLEYSIDNQIAQAFIGDRLRIRQILLNLLNNAIKFTDYGAIKLSIVVSSTHISSAGKKISTLSFQVKDQGIGISKDDKKKLFKPFSQVDASITRKFGGTGLGLIICSQLVKQMKGQMKVKSKLGEGSIFSFSIPLEHTELIAENIPMTQQEILADEQELASKYPLNILVAEDNNINQTIAKKIFAKLGYNIDIAKNGQKAVEALDNKSYDIIFMDMQMPVMDGVTATEIIMNKWQSNSPRIVAMTANVLPEDKEKCINAGMRGFIPKPINIANIIDIIKHKNRN